MSRNLFVLITLLFILANQGIAQDPVCEPDTSYADDLPGVYPGPYHPVLFPDGGIEDIACINHPFELTLTAVIKDSIDFQGLQIKLNYLEIEEDGFLNLPEGLNYACNPPNCKFEANTLGCMILTGTPLDVNAVGTYDLQLKSTIVALNGLITVTDTLPGFLIPDSHYYLELEGEDSENCQELSVNDLFLEDLGFELLNNPVSDQISVEFNLRTSSDFRLELLDLNGRVLLSKTGKGKGYQRQNLDASALTSLRSGGQGPGAYYLLRLITERGLASKKVLIL
jgi:hypothetical protein